MQLLSTNTAALRIFQAAAGGFRFKGRNSKNSRLFAPAHAFGPNKGSAQFPAQTEA